MDVGEYPYKVFLGFFFCNYSHPTIDNNFIKLLNFIKMFKFQI